MQNKRVSMQTKRSINEIIEKEDRVKFKNEDVQKEDCISSSEN